MRRAIGRLRSQWVREAVLFGWVYVGLTLINLRIKLLLAPMWLHGNLERNHKLFMSFQGTNNEQSRILQWYIPELITRFLGVSIQDAYVIQRWLFTSLAYVAFHFYLRKWFSPAGALGGVAFMAAVVPLGYFNDVQESAPLLLLTFLLGLWAIRERSTIWYMLVLLIGALNNETMLFLPAVYFSYHFQRAGTRSFIWLCATTVLTALPGIVLVATIRYFTRNRPHLGGAWHWPDNTARILEQLSSSPLDYWKSEYLYVFFLFGAFWLYAVLGLRSKPRFLGRALLVAPLFIIGHLLTGIITEVRQMMPLGFIIIPLALCFLLPARADSDRAEPTLMVGTPAAP